jgi:hypothetical protein
LAVALIFVVFSGPRFAVPSHFQLPTNILSPSFSAAGLLGGGGGSSGAATVMPAETIRKRVVVVRSLVDRMCSS